MSLGAPAVLDSPTIVLTGAYGSGKSELALNLAAYLCGRRPFDALSWSAGAVPSPPAPESVTLLDLDTVKPYFRARELEEVFRSYGVRFHGAAEGFARADVPAVSPAVLGALRLGKGRLVVDLAGDVAGARVLRGLLQSAPARSIAFLLVVNPYRPFSDVAAASLTGAELAAAAGVALSGVVANPHLLEQTTVDQVVRGYDAVVRAAAKLGLAVEWVAARGELCPALIRRLPVPVMAVRRFLRPPWERVGLAGMSPRRSE